MIAMAKSMVLTFDRLWAQVDVIILNMCWLPYLCKLKIMSSNHVACTFFSLMRS